MEDRGALPTEEGDLADVNPLLQWNARERVLIESMENNLGRSETFQVGITELEHFLLSPGDDAISIFSFAENACDEGGRNKFAVLETKRGVKGMSLEDRHRECRWYWVTSPVK